MEDAGSAADVEEEAVEDQAESGDENQRGEILGDCGRNLNRQGHAAVTTGEEIDDTGHQCVQETAAHVLSAFARMGSFECNGLRNGLAAERAARQVGGDLLPAEGATAFLHSSSLAWVGLAPVTSVSSGKRKRQALVGGMFCNGYLIGSTFHGM